MDIIPENYQNLVVLNVYPSQINKEGIDYGVGLHNWLLTTQVRYLIFDLQDEKDVLQALIEDVMQLMRRVRIPVLFCGVMMKPKKILQAFDYTAKFPVFLTPDEAIDYLKEKFPSLIETTFENIQFGQTIEMVRARLLARSDDEGEEVEEVVEEEVVEED